MYIHQLLATMGLLCLLTLHILLLLSRWIWTQKSHSHILQAYRDPLHPSSRHVHRFLLEKTTRTRNVDDIARTPGERRAKGGSKTTSPRKVGRFEHDTEARTPWMRTKQQIPHQRISSSDTESSCSDLQTRLFENGRQPLKVNPVTLGRSLEASHHAMPMSDHSNQGSFGGAIFVRMLLRAETILRHELEYYLRLANLPRSYVPRMPERTPHGL